MLAQKFQKCLVKMQKHQINFKNAIQRKIEPNV